MPASNPAASKTLRARDHRAFYKIGEGIQIDWSTIPETVRLAFCVAHRSDDVWTALRMSRKMGGQDLIGYLGGALLPTDWEDNLAVFQDIRDSAQTYTDAAVAS